MGNFMRVSLLVVCILVPLRADPAPTPVPATPDSPLSVYRINPWVDGPVLGVAALGAGAFLFEDDIIDKTCHCVREDVNRFDRYVIRHHSKAASTGSHLIVVAALTGPVIYDGIHVGWNKVFA